MRHAVTYIITVLHAQKLALHTLPKMTFTQKCAACAPAQACCMDEPTAASSRQVLCHTRWRVVSGTNLIARQNSCFVCGPSPDGCQNNKSATGRLLGNEQAYPLHLPITAYSEVCILPTSIHSMLRHISCSYSLVQHLFCTGMASSQNCKKTCHKQSTCTTVIVTADQAIDSMHFLCNKNGVVPCRYDACERVAKL